jgi:hypothetical protein
MNYARDMVGHFLDGLELRRAYQGIAPTARRCDTHEELAKWFSHAGIAAGAIARSAQTPPAKPGA